jgi:uncharacterized protein YggT (Ycf19 family)
MFRLILKLLYTIDVLIETVIIGRILLSLFPSNSSHRFVEWINSISSIFISPFEGITPSVLVIDKMEIKLTPIIALLFFAIVGFILSELLKAFRDN